MTNVGLAKGVGIVFTWTLLSLSDAGAKVYAQVGNKAITEREVARAMTGMPPEQRRILMLDPKNREQLLESIMGQEALFIEAENRKLDQSESYKQDAENFRRQWVVARLLETSLGTKVTPESVKSFYEKNKKRYTSDQVRVEHILFHDPKLAAQVLKQIRPDGKNFAELALKNTKDQTYKVNKGEIGWIGWASPVASEIRDTAMLGSKGQVFGPIRTSSGYHLIRIIERKDGKPVPFQEVAGFVQEDLKQALTKQFTEMMKTKHAAKSLDTNLEGL